MMTPAATFLHPSITHDRSRYSLESQTRHCTKRRSFFHRFTNVTERPRAGEQMPANSCLYSSIEPFLSASEHLRLPLCRWIYCTYSSLVYAFRAFSDPYTASAMQDTRRIVRSSNTQDLNVHRHGKGCYGGCLTRQRRV